jgi:ATP-dependent DNA helicase DinG
VLSTRLQLVEPCADILSAAVAAVDGAARVGQQQMALAVVSALESHTHLLVQAGTGTGKSLGY